MALANIPFGILYHDIVIHSQSRFKLIQYTIVLYADSARSPNR